MPQFSPKLDKAQIAKLTKLWKEGIPVSDISLVLGVTKRTVYRYRRILGLPIRKKNSVNSQKKPVVREELRQMIRQNIPRIKIAQHYGICLRTLTNYKKVLGIKDPFSTGRSLTINEIEEELPRLHYTERRSVKDLSDYFGVSVWTIQHWLRRLRREGGRIVEGTQPFEVDVSRLNYDGRTIPIATRQQILKEVEQGEKPHLVAARHKIHRSTITRWQQLYKKTGSVCPGNIRRIYLIEPEKEDAWTLGK